MLALELANWLILIIGLPLIILTTWLVIRSFDPGLEFLRLGPKLHFWKHAASHRQAAEPDKHAVAPPSKSGIFPI